MFVHDTELPIRARRILIELDAEFIPLARLAGMLRVPEDSLGTAAQQAPFLGICEDPEPVVYCLPPEPIAAGFTVRRRAGRLVLRLRGRATRPALLISGCHLGSGFPHGQAGAGQLAYTVGRMTQLARDWLPPTVADPARYLFELIAEAWRCGCVRRLAGGLHVCRVDFDGLIATDTNRLELVTNRCVPAGRLTGRPPHAGFAGAHLLVNAYPIPVRG